MTTLTLAALITLFCLGPALFLTIGLCAAAADRIPTIDDGRAFGGDE